MNLDASAKNNLAIFFYVLGIILTMTFLFSNFIGLSRTGFESSQILELQTFYLIGGVLAVALMAFKMNEVLTREGDNKYGNSIGFASIGKWPHSRFFKRFTTLQLVLYSIILFGLMGLLNATIFPQTSYTGVGFLETQQFTQIDSTIYTALLIPGAENLGFAAFFAFLVTSLGYIARRTNLSKESFRVFYWVVPIIIGGLFGAGNHLLRYGGSDMAIFTVWMFWSLGGLITVVTGSFIPFWIMHIMNNLFIDLQRFFSNEVMMPVILAILVGLSIITFFLYQGRLLGKKGK